MKTFHFHYHDAPSVSPLVCHARDFRNYSKGMDQGSHFVLLELVVAARTACTADAGTADAGTADAADTGAADAGAADAGFVSAAG